MSLQTRLSFLSWNLAMLERPAAAPLDWGQEHTQAEVRRLVLELSPDVVLFQELPGIVPYAETHDMLRANPRSHSGNLATLVGNHLLDDVPHKPTASTVQGVAVLATFGEDLTVANVHLAPGPGAASLRLEQLSAVLAASTTDALVIIGDTNCRTEEEAAIAELGLIGPRPPKPTWDSRRNRFRSSGPEFVAYFTRHFATGPVSVEDVVVLSDPTTAVGQSQFHLSDHFAMSGTIVMDAEAG